MVQYMVTNLGDLGGNESIGMDASVSGHCAAMARLPSFAVQACIYRAGTMMLHPLPTWGGFNSVAYGINAASQIVGYDTLPSNQYHAALWNPGMPPIDINPFGGTFSEALGISDLGHVTGFGGLAAGGRHGFMRDPAGVVADLGTLGGPYSSGHDVNVLGNVAGQAYSGPSELHAFFWTAATGVMANIAPAGATWSRAEAINRANAIVGTYFRPPDTRRPFIWTANNGALDLVNQGSVEPRDLNDLDEVVGQMSVATSAWYHAFHFKGGVLTDLNDVIDPGSGWELHTARGIDNLGHIVGDGTFKGARRGFLLSPVVVVPPEDPELNDDVWRRVQGYVLVNSILSGIVDDRPGVWVPPGKGPTPVGPWGGMPFWRSLTPSARDALLARAVAILAGQIGEDRARAEVLKSVEKFRVAAGTA